MAGTVEKISNIIVTLLYHLCIFLYRNENFDIRISDLFRNYLPAKASPACHDSMPASQAKRGSQGQCRARLAMRAGELDISNCLSLKICYSFSPRL